MLLKDLMKDYTPNASYTGEVMADDYVLAIKVGSTSEKVADYAVVQEHTKGVDSSLNSESNDKQYIRSGKSTTKKSTQRTFTITADRYEGDEAQDYMDSVKHKTGSDVITDYVYFSLKTGKGEKGKISIAVNKDGGGNAGDNAGFSATLSKNGAAPTEYTYADDST